MKKNLLITFILLIVAGTAYSTQCLPSGTWDSSNFISQYPAETLASEYSIWQVVGIDEKAENYTLTITANNVNGAARSNAEVVLYNASNIELTRVTANSSGQATFLALENGTYNYKVYYTPSLLNVPFAENKEFWGNGTITISGSAVSETFTRNAPYISVGPTFNPINLTPGQSTSGSFMVKNTLPSPADSYIAIWIDRDKASTWDFSSNDQANAKPISIGGNAAFPFNVTPTSDGTYSCYAFVYSKINGTYIITDQYNWAQVFTVATVTAISQINWSGYTWKVKGGVGGPGPNNWNASSSNIWVDVQGNLHLKIIKIGDKWYCSEITLLQSLGYGEYTFEISTNVENLDKNIVFGLFTYETDSKEIDIEFSRWGNSAKVDGWFTVQPPPYTTLNQNSYALNLEGDYSSHQFKWSSSQIDFKSYHGHGLDNLINQWSYKGVNNPPAGKEKIHLNLWLFQGTAPSNIQEAEVVIKSFKYVPNLFNSSIEELPNTNKIELYPNPTKGPVNISSRVLGIKGDSKIDVFNNIGLLVQSKNTSSDYNTAQIDLSGYSNGIYLIKIDSNNQSFFRKIIKE